MSRLSTEPACPPLPDNGSGRPYHGCRWLMAVSVAVTASADGDTWFHDHGLWFPTLIAIDEPGAS